MDILGYKDMTRSAELENRSQILLDELYGPLKTAREWLEDAYIELSESTPKDRFVLRAFTDNIVMGWPLTVSAVGPALCHALRKVSSFQLDMATRGFFIRGAIAVGDVFIDEVAVFGPALLDAYEAEQVYADTPRVILTDTAEKAEADYRTIYPKSENYPLSEYLSKDKDKDNRWFVNYLTSGLQVEQLVANHKDVVSAKLKEFHADRKILKKYQWVAQYHNSFCDEHAERFGQQKLPAS